MARNGILSRSSRAAIPMMTSGPRNRTQFFQLAPVLGLAEFSWLTVKKILSVVLAVLVFGF